MFKGALSGPIVQDKLFFGVSGKITKRDGYVDNIFLDQKADDRDDKSIRANLRWTPTENFDATLGVDGERFRGGAYPLGPLQEIRDHPSRVSNDFAGDDNRDSFGSTLNINWKLPLANFTSITGWRDVDNDSRGDQDGTAMDIVPVTTVESQQQFTQEVRLASPDNNGPLKWVAGVYYYKSDFDEHTEQKFGVDAAALGFVPFPMDNVLHATKDDSGYAFFGQLDYQLTDQLTLTGGLRRAFDKRCVHVIDHLEAGGFVIPGTAGSVDGTLNFDVWLPKAAVSFKFTPEFTAYGTVAKGYRAGGFNTLHPDPADASFDPEFSMNYEVGVKSTLWQNRLSLNLSVFHIDLSDQQLFQLTPAFKSVVRNAGQSYSRGLEIEMKLRPADGWDINAGFGYLDTVFDEYVDPVAGADYAGKRVPYVPRYNFNIAVQNRLPLSGSMELVSRLELQHIGESFWDAANTQKESAYQLVNARIGVESEHWKAFLWGKNIFDQGYADMVYDFPALGPRAQAGDPRTFGLTVSANF